MSEKSWPILYIVFLLCVRLLGHIVSVVHEFCLYSYLCKNDNFTNLAVSVKNIVSVSIIHFVRMSACNI